MGHGINFCSWTASPAAASGKSVIRLGEVGVLRGSSHLECVAIDSFIDHLLERMEVEDDPVKTTSLQNDLLLSLVRARGAVWSMASFHAWTSTSGHPPRTRWYMLEDQPYGCFIPHKGVIF